MQPSAMSPSEHANQKMLNLNEMTTILWAYENTTAPDHHGPLHFPPIEKF
jgi:hypothetical protein